MLTIRQAQFVAFERTMHGAFERRMVEHLRELHCERFAAMLEDEALEFVRRTLARARDCGVDGDEGFCVFLELTLQFGAEFPSGCDWAQQTLARFSGLPRERRVKALLDAAMRHLDAEEERRAEDIERLEAAGRAPSNFGDEDVGKEA